MIDSCQWDEKSAACVCKPVCQHCNQQEALDTEGSILPAQHMDQRTALVDISSSDTGHYHYYNGRSCSDRSDVEIPFHSDNQYPHNCIHCNCFDNRSLDEDYCSSVVGTRDFHMSHVHQYKHSPHTDLWDSGKCHHY